MTRAFLAFWLILIIGGAVWWMKIGQYSELANKLPIPHQAPQIDGKAVAHGVDSEIAQSIRDASQNGVHLPAIVQSASSQFNSATISASVSTTPESVMKDVREKGAQAALSGVLSTAKIDVNNVSANVVNEARYQYCKGVVLTYESPHP